MVPARPLSRVGAALVMLLASPGTAAATPRTTAGLPRVLGAASHPTLAGLGAAGTSSTSVAAVQLRVAQFNCDIADEYPKIRAAYVASAIRRSNADVVGIEEGGGEIPQIAKALGWRYYDIRMQIVSRLPLIDPPGGNGVYTFVQLGSAGVVAMENVHLPSNPYGPYWVRDGKSLSRVLALENRLRVPPLRASLRAARTLLSRGIPVFLTGDFNSPSWRDWTTAMVHARFQIRYAVRWPASVAVERAGFVDSFRAAYPNPASVPGLTWPTRRTIPGVANPGPGAPADRIDFVYAAGAARTTASAIIGEPGAPGILAATAPWPSDHRLVVSAFDLQPGPPPTLVTVDRRAITVGRPVTIRFHLATRQATRLVVVRGSSAPPRAAIMVKRIPRRVSDGILRFSRRGLSPGGYAALLVDRTGRVLARYPFWLLKPGVRPTIVPSKMVYRVGEPIVARIQNAPGERWDWIAIYKHGANPAVAGYGPWRYTHSIIDGSVTLDTKTAQAGSVSKWPVRPGTYSLYLLKDDLYVKIAATTVRIVPPRS
jgi:endonuclease/exonuclease/phosphatase (EEP) superfamily protein YafD